MRLVVPSLILILLFSTSAHAIEADLSFQSYRQVKINLELQENASSLELYYAEESFSNISNATLYGIYPIQSVENLSRGEIGTFIEECWTDGLPVYRDSVGHVVIDNNASTFSCVLSGFIPDQPRWFTAAFFDSNGEIMNNASLASFELRSTQADVLPPAADTSPILFAIGSITLSLIALFGYWRWKDAKEGKSTSKMAHFYIAPAMLALAILTFYPVLYGFWLAFTDADQTRLGDQQWIGIANFIAVFSASGFFRVTGFTLLWTVINVTAHVGIGLFLAMILQNARLAGKTVYRTILLLPWAIPSYISVLVWRGMFQPSGFVNDVLGTQMDWLSDPTGAQVLVILVNIWLGVPFMMMSLSGALQALPKEMYEASQIDGVNRWQQFLHLTLPNLKSALVPLSLLGFIWTFNMFNVIYLMTDGGPNLWFGEPGSTDILITYVYDVAFRDGAYGVAAAWSVVIFLMLLAFSWVYMKQTRATEAVV